MLHFRLVADDPSSQRSMVGPCALGKIQACTNLRETPLMCTICVRDSGR